MTDRETEKWIQLKDRESSINTINYRRSKMMNCRHHLLMTLIYPVSLSAYSDVTDEGQRSMLMINENSKDSDNFSLRQTFVS